MADFITQRYSKAGLGTLSLTCAFPVHLWALILNLRDIPWMSERTNLWDAIGAASYGLLLAFSESVLIFLAVVLLGLVIPRSWDPERRTALLGMLVLLVSLWAMVSQLLFLWDVSLPAQALAFLRGSRHPLRILYAASLVIVTPTILLPVYLLVRTERMVALMQDLMERLSLLSLLYLFFDLLGLVVVLIRNISS